MILIVDDEMLVRRVAEVAWHAGSAGFLSRPDLDDQFVGAMPRLLDGFPSRSGERTRISY